MKLDDAVMACFVVALVLLNGTSTAEAERLDGYFIAQRSCEAFQSKNKRTNPGNVTTQIDRAYEMIAINKVGGDHFQIRIADVPVTRDRWVHVACGLHVVDANTSTANIPRPIKNPLPAEPGEESTDNLLALSWQPAFCETRPNKKECQTLNAGHLPSATEGLSLHGLWAQPRGKVYCGVPPAVEELDKSGEWSLLPEPNVDAVTREALVASMPGTASFLDRHEWIKHGTCHKGERGADEYFDDTLLVLDAINNSVVGAFFADHVGAEVRTGDIRDLFDQAFGNGAGSRVQFQCTGDGRRTLIKELKINLMGEIADGVSVSDLLLAAEPVSAGCQRGFVDAAGLQ